MMISDLTIKKHIGNLNNHLNKLLKTPGHNEYAVLYYQGKIDALRSLLKNGEKMYEMDKSFGL